MVSSISKDLLNSDFCPECDSSDYIEINSKDGDVVCTRCAVIVGKYISELPEWRTFVDSTQANKSRVAIVDELTGSSTTTTITRSFKRQSIQTLQRTLETDHDRKLRKAFSRISQYADMLQFPDSIKKSAHRLFKEYDRRNGNWKNSGVFAAVLYIAAKQEKVPRTIKELSRDLSLPEKQITKCYRTVKEIIGVNEQRTSAEDLIDRMCTQLGIREYAVIKQIKRVAKKAMTQEEGRLPSTIAAASIWCVCKKQDIKVDEFDISPIALVATSTVAAVGRKLRNLEED